MNSFNRTTDESRSRWETNADYWDNRMGDHSNHFHCNVVRPHTEELLNIQAGDLVLDVACGTGNFSERLAEKGAVVVAFDYSERMILHAKRRRRDHLGKIKFHVCDATKSENLIALKQDRMFDKAVANMALMDISDVKPLFNALFALLKPGGIFVFSLQHPCFVRTADNYMTQSNYEGEAIRGQPVLQYYYHRSLQDILNIAFQAGFIIDGFFEVPDDDDEIPAVAIIRARKPGVSVQL